MWQTSNGCGLEDEEDEADEADESVRRNEERQKRFWGGSESTC